MAKFALVRAAEPRVYQVEPGSGEAQADEPFLVAEPLRWVACPDDTTEFHLFDGSAGFTAPTVDLSAYAKMKRDATELSGITVNGIAVASDPDSQTRVANAYAGMQVTGAPSIRFKAASGFIVLSLDQVKAIGSALFAHTQACFDAEDEVDAALSAAPPTITTTDQVDAVFAAVRSAY